MTNLFVCTTQYQLFNIINLINSYYSKDNNKLIVIKIRENSGKIISEIANKSLIFNNVDYLELGQAYFDVYNKFEKIKYYFNCISKILFSQTLKLNGTNIDRLFITGTDIFSRIISCKLLKKYKNMDLFYYEDGMASYFDVISSKIYDNKNKILKARFGFYLIDKCQAMFVYMPEYVLDNPRKITICKINHVNSESEYAKNMYRIFSGKNPENRVKENKLECIYFDGNFDKNEDLENSQQLISTIQMNIKRELIVKPHPQTKEKWKTEKIKILDIKESFEIYSLNNSCEGKVLISVISTACVTPKIIFGQEPKVILLYKLFTNSELYWNGIDKIFKEIKKSYSNPFDFAIPENIDELRFVLRRWNL